jgi:hypothetical protein
MQMTDQELLQLAAKAAGMDDAEYQDGTGWMEGRYGYPVAIWSESLGAYWNPLEDDSDALRLAVKLQLEIIPLEGGGVDIERTTEAEPFGILLATESGPDPYAATRRAIVHAAAEIGKARPTPTGDGA